MLIKRTRSLCPTCNSVLDAEIVEEEGKIWLKRTCPVHGNFRHLYWSDARMYHRFQEYDAVGNGIANPQNTAPPGKLSHRLRDLQQPPLPDPAGKYRSHQPLQPGLRLLFCKRPGLRVHLRASFDEIVGMMQVLKYEKPIPAPAVQFSGGEPTMRDDLPEIIRKAKAMGFPQVQIATNGVKPAKDPALAQRAQGRRAQHGLPPFRWRDPADKPLP